MARPSLSSTRRWACAPRALCTRPEWTLGARARGGGRAGGWAGLGWAGQHAVAPWGTDGRVSPLTRASGRCCQAKTTKKITLKLTCSACKAVRLKPIKRAKHFEICDKKPKTKGQMY